MKIQQFAKQLEKEDHPSPLLEALQAMRRYDLSKLRELMRVGVLVWVQWPEPVELSRAEKDM